MSHLDFSRRVPVIVHRSTFGMKLCGFFVSYPGPLLGLVGIVLLMLVLRTAAIGGLVLFPLFALARAVHRQEQAERRLGVVPVELDTANVPPIALVAVRKAGLSIEGIEMTLSPGSLLPAIVDERGTRIHLRTKRDLPNFTLMFEQAADAQSFLAALAELDEATPTKVPTPALLERGDLTIDDWVERLRAQDHVAYRSAPLLPDDLWQVLEDDDASLPARAAAVIALAPRLDKQGRERWRALKTDCPYRLRVVMKAARGTDRTAMSQALEACLHD